MTERRSQNRLLDAELVLLGWQQSNTHLKQLGNVEDLSGNGMAVVVNEPIPIGSKVTICYGENTLTGSVRRLGTRVNDILLGIEFDESSKNAAEHFDPELLIQGLS